MKTFIKRNVARDPYRCTVLQDLLRNVLRKELPDGKKKEVTKRVSKRSTATELKYYSRLYG